MADTKIEPAVTLMVEIRSYDRFQWEGAVLPGHLSTIATSSHISPQDVLRSLANQMDRYGINYLLYPDEKS